MGEVKPEPTGNGEVKPEPTGNGEVKPEPKNGGAVRQIIITGASGFVGSACVAEARRRGIAVTALVRQNLRPEWEADPGITFLRADLSDPRCVEPLRDAMPDAVIHAAAHLGGDSAAHQADTVTGTKHLLDAMQGKGARLVLVSSIAVYDTDRIAPGSAVTEDAPLIDLNASPDAYAAAKLEQEEACRASGLPLWILRPGAIYGPGRTWHALMGFWASRLHMQIASDGELPTTHVDHCAWALVEAAIRVPDGVSPLNVIDDDRPTRGRYLSAHKDMAGWPKLSLPMPWRVWLGIAQALSPLGNRLPGLLRPTILRRRVMPLRWPNDALRAALGGQDDAPFENMLRRSLEAKG